MVRYKTLYLGNSVSVVRQMLDDIEVYHMQAAFHPGCVCVCTSIYFNIMPVDSFDATYYFLDSTIGVYEQFLIKNAKELDQCVINHVNDIVLSHV